MLEPSIVPPSPLGYVGERDSGGKMHGKGKMIWKNGAIYDGNWKDGKRD